LNHEMPNSRSKFTTPHSILSPFATMAFRGLGNFARKSGMDSLFHLHSSALNSCTITILSIRHAHSLSACHLLLPGHKDGGEPVSGILKSDKAGVNRAHARNQRGVPYPSPRLSRSVPNHRRVLKVPSSKGLPGHPKPYTASNRLG